MNTYIKFLSISALLATASCASIIQGSTDSVNINTTANHPAMCELKNERGTWSVTSPNTVAVKKSKTDLTVSCTDRRTGANGTKTVNSEMESWVIADVVIAPIISFPVDFITGAAWDYPTDITVPVQMSQPDLHTNAEPPAPPVPYSSTQISSLETQAGDKTEGETKSEVAVPQTSSGNHTMGQPAGTLGSRKWAPY